MKEDFVPCFFPVTAMYIWRLLRSLSERASNILRPCSERLRSKPLSKGVWRGDEQC